MNFPCSATNQVFKREWINYYQTIPRNLVICTAVDLASAEKEESSDPDYNVILTAGINPYNGNIYIIHYTRERMSPSSVINSIFDHYRAYKPVKVILEGIGYQRTLQHWLEQKQRKHNCLFTVDVITSHKASKVDRIRGLQPFFAASRIFIKSGMDELERELLSFPKGAHDDIVDTLSMELDFFNTSTTLVDQDKEARLSRNPFSFDLILKELNARNMKPKQYPYDMGIMRMRLDPLRTDYTYTRSY